jgi:phosphoribosyl 1,2-cyclic phosphodiesterase
MSSSNSACIEVRHEETLIICDAGSGIRELGEDLLTRSNQPITGHLLFSHCHWDHIQGFPFFSPAYRRENRFYIHGRHPGDDRFYRLLSGQMESDYFPIGFQALRAEISSSDLEAAGNKIGCVQVRWMSGIFSPGGFSEGRLFNGLRVADSH